MFYSPTRFPLAGNRKLHFSHMNGLVWDQRWAAEDGKASRYQRGEVTKTITFFLSTHPSTGRG